MALRTPALRAAYPRQEGHGGNRAGHTFQNVEELVPTGHCDQSQALHTCASFSGCSFAQVPLIKHRRPGGLNIRHVFPQSSGGHESKVKVTAGLGSSEPLSLVRPLAATASGVLALCALIPDVSPHVS